MGKVHQIENKSEHKPNKTSSWATFDIKQTPCSVTKVWKTPIFCIRIQYTNTGQNEKNTTSMLVIVFDLSFSIYNFII